MNQAEEDACRSWFYASKYAQVILPKGYDFQVAKDAWSAAVAHERERAARVCEELHPQWQKGDEYTTPMDCAAAIRRGE